MDRQSPTRGALALLLLLGLASPGARANAIDEAIATHGWPARHVAGVALVKLADVPLHHLRLPRKSDAAARTVLDDIAARTGLRLTLERTTPFGWGLFRVRADDAATAREVPDEAETERLIERLRADPAVADAVVDKWARPSATPSDPYYSVMWHLQMVNAAVAWDTTTGLSTQRIAVVDTGLLRNHVDLSAKDVAGYDFISTTAISNDGDGRDTNYADPGDGGDCGAGYYDDSWHGTHVAGTALASANNGTGVVGVNWNAGLVTARVLGVCGGDFVDIMSGAAWAAGGSIDNVPDLPVTSRASVINLSLGGTGACSSFEQDALNYIDGFGAVVVVAAGNAGSVVDSPANCPSAIAVGAFGDDAARAAYSNWGPEIDVVAPGGNFSNGDGVYSAVGPGNTEYAAYEGTSMATPHVAGAISLAHALDPTLTRADVLPLLNSGITCSNCGAVPALQLDLLVDAVVPGGVVTPPPAPVDDSYEENDTFAAASPVACDTTVSAFAAAQDFDFYRVSLSSGATMTVSLQTAGGTDHDLYVVKGMDFVGGDVLQASETPTGTESVTHTQDATTVALLVNPYFDEQTGNANAGSYTLTIACTGNTAPPPTTTPPTTEPPGTEIAADPDEPNDTKEEAAPLLCDTGVDNTMTGDDDWYAVTVEDGTDLGLSVRADTVHPSVAIYTSNGETQLASGDGEGLQVTASLQGLGAGTYLVHVPVFGDDRYAIVATCDVSESGDGGCAHVTTTTGAPLLGVALLACALTRVRRRRATRSRDD